MRSLWMAAVWLAAIGCKDGKKDSKKPGNAPGLDAACVAALRAGDAGLALERCTPCGVSFRPLAAMSSTDPDAVAEALPGPIEVFEILDACQATCKGTTRTEVSELLRKAQDGRTPAAPWRRIAEKCAGALRTDEHTLRFARGTLYALDRIAAAIWDDAASPEVVALRDPPPVFPLPPLTAASTGYAFPRVDQLADWRPRVHVTITESQVHAGALPELVLGKDGPRLVDGAGLDYPGDELAGGALPDPIRSAERVLVIAPRGMRASRVLTVIAAMEHPVFLAATPKTRGQEPWSEPVFAIPVGLSARPDGAEPLVLPASHTVADLAGALAGLAERGVDTAYVTLDPMSSP